jgi:hypothetical protein
MWQTEYQSLVRLKWIWPKRDSVFVQVRSADIEPQHCSLQQVIIVARHGLSHKDGNWIIGAVYMLSMLRLNADVYGGRGVKSLSRSVGYL